MQKGTGTIALGGPRTCGQDLLRRCNQRLRETWPVERMPIAWAAAGVRSMCLPATNGPRSLMRTTTHPLWQILTREPNGSVRCAAVRAPQFIRSPLAVRLPQRPSDPPYTLAISACAALLRPRHATTKPADSIPRRRPPFLKNIVVPYALYLPVPRMKFLWAEIDEIMETPPRLP
jgi:hypothetical protein